MIRSTVLTRSAPLAALVAAVLLALAPGAAKAADAASCDGGTVSRPFLPWLDLAQYELAPNGGFEAGSASWTLDGGAQLAGDNEPWHVRDAGDGQALELAAGASATSSAMCVRLLDPTMRFFVRNQGSSDATLTVHALFTGLLGQDRDVRIATLHGGDDWRPTQPIAILANLSSLPLLGDGSTDLRIRLEAQGDGADFTVDDVYVDPFKTK